MADKSEKSRKFSPKFSSRIRQRLRSKAEDLDHEHGNDFPEFAQMLEVTSSNSTGNNNSQAPEIHAFKPFEAIQNHGSTSDNDESSPHDFAGRAEHQSQFSDKYIDVTSFFPSTKKISVFIDNGDGTVTDSRTNLMWMRSALGQTWEGDSCSGKCNSYAWAQAVAIRHSFAGYDDWRLPTAPELKRIVDPKHTNPAIEAEAFPRTPNLSFWSSTINKNEAESAWRVDFRNGLSGTDSKRLHLPVRLLRGKKFLTNFDLHIVITGMGSGSVARTPPNLVSNADCHANYLNGATVTVAATADVGSVFTGWTGDITGSETTFTVQMDSDKCMRAIFSLAEAPEYVDGTESQFKLGKKYHDGDGVKRDFEKAAECYSKAAKLGHARAQNNLGLLYSAGLGVQRDRKEAAIWFMKAAEQGLDIAQYNIASYFLEKYGALPYDPEQAAMWYLKAAEQGNSDAQCSLGEMFEEGVGVPQNNQQAKDYYLKAALQDDETAQSWLWRRARLESTEQPECLLEVTMPATTANASFRLAPDHAVALVRAAIDLLKQNPNAFLPELVDLRSVIFANSAATPSQAVISEESPFPADAPPLTKVVRWLLGHESVTLVALRTYLLPLDLLPGAVIDELNELALNLVGEPALEEDGDEIRVAHELLADVLADWQDKT